MFGENVVTLQQRRVCVCETDRRKKLFTLKKFTVMKKFSILVLSVCALLLLWSCKGSATERESAGTENPLGVKMPEVVKFVRVTSEQGAEVFEYADSESPWRVTWVEDLESDMAEVVVKWSNEDVPDGYRCEETVAYAGEVLAVLGEEGDFWKVSIRCEAAQYCEMESGFVKKSDVEDVEPGKVTAEMLEAVEWEHTRVMKEGKWKGLVLRSVQDELNGETFEVGVMLDGVVAFPAGNTLFIEYDPEAKDLTIVENNEDGRFPVYFRYPKSMGIMPEGADYPQGFDPEKLTDKQIEKLVQDVMQHGWTYVKYEYAMPMTEGGIVSFWLKSK